MVPIVNSNGEFVGPGHRKTSPEQILVQGILKSGAVVSLAFRKPKVSIDGVGFRWLITGTEGEIEAIAPEYHFQMEHPDRKLRIRTSSAEKAEEVHFREDSTSDVTDASETRVKVLNTANIYNAFVNGDESRYATFESALKTHRLLDEIVRKANFSY